MENFAPVRLDRRGPYYTACQCFGSGRKAGTGPQVSFVDYIPAFTQVFPQNFNLSQFLLAVFNIHHFLQKTKDKRRMNLVNSFPLQEVINEAFYPSNLIQGYCVLEYFAQITNNGLMAYQNS